ncbi:MAG TPA: YraN family protein, partial [Rhodospirillaceae bacterium]|nr:YraN family protein [Rhodospirillaceae bacterium]
QRLCRAAAAFLAQRPDLAALNPRFDVVLVRPWRWPRHLMDAWREEV